MVKETLSEAEHIRAKSFKEELMRTGKWGKPLPITQ